MAKVRINRNALRNLEAKCPKCRVDIHEFLTILRDASSLDPDPFVAIGMVRVHNHILLADGSPRRHRRYQLRLCGGHIGFYWKKANVEHISVDC